MILEAKGTDWLEQPMGVTDRPLGYAIVMGWVDGVVRLLDAGCNVNAPAPNTGKERDRWLVADALDADRAAIIDILVQRGLDVVAWLGRDLPFSKLASCTEMPAQAERFLAIMASSGWASNAGIGLMAAFWRISYLQAHSDVTPQTLSAVIERLRPSLLDMAPHQDPWLLLMTLAHRSARGSPTRKHEAERVLTTLDGLLAAHGGVWPPISDPITKRWPSLAAVQASKSRHVALRRPAPGRTP